MMRKLKEKPEYLRFERPFEDYEDCLERLKKDHALLEVIVKEPRVMQISQNVRVSFEDKLGIAGGTIGLFSGLSLISVVETLYWIARFIMERSKALAAQRREARKTNAGENARKTQVQEMKIFN